MKRGVKIAIGVLLTLLTLLVAVFATGIVSVRVDLPPAEPSKIAPVPPVFVTISSDGGLTVDGAPTTLDTLTRDVSARFVGVPKDQQRVMIRSTGDVKYNHFMAVLSRLEVHGWTKVGLIKDAPP